MKSKIGVLREIKDNEYRVGLTPNAVKCLTSQKHSVVVQSGAGVGSGFSDEDYRNVGAYIENNPLTVAGASDIVIKIKEPIEEEYYWMKFLQGRTLFTFLHLSANPGLAKALNENLITGISYDTIEDENGIIPLLKPMSEIAGQFAAEFAINHTGPNNIKKAVIMGGGTVGLASINSLVAAGVPRIVVYEKNHDRAEYLRQMFSHSNGSTVEIFEMTHQYGLAGNLSECDVLIGAVLVKGAKAPEVVGQEHVKMMKKSSLIVDVAIDQGGCIYGARPTSHSEPLYALEGKTYCCIPNMPGMRPREATEALVGASLPYVRLLANFGSPAALDLKEGFYKGLNTYRGEIINESIKMDLEGA